VAARSAHVDRDGQGGRRRPRHRLQAQRRFDDWGIDFDADGHVVYFTAVVEKANHANQDAYLHFHLIDEVGNAPVLFGMSSNNAPQLGMTAPRTQYWTGATPMNGPVRLIGKIVVSADGPDRLFLDAQPASVSLGAEPDRYALEQRVSQTGTAVGLKIVIGPQTTASVHEIRIAKTWSACAGSR